MNILPSRINRLISRIRVSSDTTIPTYEVKDRTTVTLFDDLPDEERKAALKKLDQLVSVQPAKPSQPVSTQPSSHRRRIFSWRIFIMVFLGLGFIAFATVASVALAVDTTKDPELVAKLRMASTNLDRMALLPNDEDWFFDFTKQDKYTFSPGGVINANAATFPATVGQGMTLAMLNLGACSMLPPHLHPRAANYVVAISGTTQTYMINENGARTVQATLRSGQMTIFPTGSIHTMMNIGCENAQLISALNSDDTGTLNVANAFFSLPQNISGTVLGGDVNVQNVFGQIPQPGTGANFGPDQCIAACAAKGKTVKRTF